MERELKGVNKLNSGKLKMYEKEYEIYFKSLKEGEEVLSLKEYIESMRCVTEEKEEKQNEHTERQRQKRHQRIFRKMGENSLSAY